MPTHYQQLISQDSVLLRGVAVSERFLGYHLTWEIYSLGVLSCQEAVLYAVMLVAILEMVRDDLEMFKVGRGLLGLV